MAALTKRRSSILFRHTIVLCQYFLLGRLSTDGCSHEAHYPDVRLIASDPRRPEQEHWEEPSRFLLLKESTLKSRGEFQSMMIAGLLPPGSAPTTCIPWIDLSSLSWLLICDVSGE
jgi:hypothetical protein